MASEARNRGGLASSSFLSPPRLPAGGTEDVVASGSDDGASVEEADKHAADMARSAYGEIPIITGANARSPNIFGRPVQTALTGTPTPTATPPTSAREDRKGKAKQVVDLTGERRPVTIDLDTYHKGPSLSLAATDDSSKTTTTTKQPVCFGEIRTAALLLYERQSNVKDTLRTDVPPRYRKRDPVAGRSMEYDDPESYWEPVYIESRPSVRSAGEYDMRVLTQKSENLGVVENKVSQVMGAPWMQGLVWGEARTERKRSGYVAKLHITVYGHPFNAMTFPTLLFRNQIYLEQPLYFDHRARYHNPHNPPPGGFAAQVAKAQYSSAMTSDRYRGRYALQAGGAGSTISRGASDTASQIDSLFRSLGTSADTPEAVQPSSLLTPLYKHQRQAIWYINDRESIHDFDEEEDVQVIDPPGSSKSVNGRASKSKKRMVSLYQKSRGPSGDVYTNVITHAEKYGPPDQCRGCIIADDMGLGKTVSTLGAILATQSQSQDFAHSSPTQVPSAQNRSKKISALEDSSVLDLGRSHTLTGRHISADTVMYEKARLAKQSQKRKLAEALALVENIQPQQRTKSTLIVAPLSTVAGWEQQIAEHVEADALSVYVYHGASRTTDPKELTQFDIVITTYNLIVTEFSRTKRSTLKESADRTEDADALDESDYESDSKKSKVRKRRKGTGSSGTSNSTTPYSPLQLTEWFRIVLDEAHVIKDPATLQSRAVCALKAQRRVCLTGTPVQNHLNDLYALIKFLHLSPLDDRGIWNKYISFPIKYGDPSGITRLQLLMRSLCLRRTKTQKDADGKSILELPARRDVIRQVNLGPQEKALYDSNAARTKKQFNDLLSRGLVMKNMVSILQEIMRLRQICTHFAMMQDYEDKRDLGNDTSSSVDLSSAIDLYGLTPKRARTLFTLLQESGSGVCNLCNKEYEPNESAFVTRCHHLYCLECLQKDVWKAWPRHDASNLASCAVCSKDLQVATDIYELKALDPDQDDAPGDVTVSNGSKRQASTRSTRRRGKDYVVQHSSKVLLLTEELLKLREDAPADGQRPVKTVVFSQWTSCLNRIEDALDEVQLVYRRLDGTMDRESRAESLKAFAQDDQVLVLLISLRAGGVGLNLTSASRVYLMEPSWNPQAEAQAVDRIHRLGQTREVDIIRFIVPDSVESNMVKLQERKLMLAQVTLSEQRMTKEQMTDARLNELKALFR